MSQIRRRGTAVDSTAEIGPRAIDGGDRPRSIRPGPPPSCPARGRPPVFCRPPLPLPGSPVSSSAALIGPLIGTPIGPSALGRALAWALRWKLERASTVEEGARESASAIGSWSLRW
eukprot:9298191-Pyramimonas_sp.AAC.1